MSTAVSLHDNYLMHTLNIIWQHSSDTTLARNIYW